MLPPFGRIASPRRVVVPIGLVLSFACIAAPLPAAADTPATSSTTVLTEAPQGVAAVNAAAHTPLDARLSESVVDALRAYEAAREKVAALSAQSARLSEAAEQAEVTAGGLREEVAGGDGGGVVDVLVGLVSGGDSDLDLADTAAKDAADALAIAAIAEAGLRQAMVETERARRSWERARAALTDVEAGWTARKAAQVSLSLAEFRPGYAVTDAAQDRRNRTALNRWKSYLSSLGQLGVLPPDARKLVDPDALPRGLEIVRDASGRAVPGVAASDTGEVVATVLPAETIRAVSSAFSRLGLVDVPGAVEPSVYGCGGLVANVWSATATLPGDSVTQWQELRSVPMASLQVGDVVVLGSNRAGLEQSGVYVGDRKLILADPVTGTAAVQPLARDAVYGVKRVGLDPSRKYDSPAAGACGVVVAPEEPAPTVPVPGAVSEGPLTLPVAAGSYRLSAQFGDSSSLWSSGEHTGLDFAAPTGTEVSAVAGGTVTVETVSWAGNLVRIDHGGGVESWYAHLSAVDVETGEVVSVGQLIGAVGNEGNSTGPHLHLEVRLDESPIDPALALDVPEQPRPTYANGDIPSSALCAATADGGQLLRCDAAVGYRMLSAAFEEHVGEPLCITDSYRSYAGQEEVFRTKPGLGAVPGTSVHGEGLAVDLCGGVESFDTAEHAWLAAQGAAFGWEHPSWAAAGGSRPEPWHFEYSS